MKEILINFIILTISLSVVIWYHLINIKLQGVKSSISKWAQYHEDQKPKTIYKTYIFIIIGLTFPFSYFGRGTIPGIIVSGMISYIAGFTGYNPEIKNKKFEDIAHVGFTFLTIAGLLFILININLLFIPFGVLWLLYAWYATKKKIENHTLIIEYIGIYLGFALLYVAKVIILLIDMNYDLKLAINIILGICILITLGIIFFTGIKNCIKWIINKLKRK